MRAEELRREEGRLASLTLRAGIWASGAMMSVGALSAAWRPSSLPPGPPDWTAVLARAAALDGAALSLLGVAILVATPFLRVILVGAAFARGRQWRLLAVSAAVLGLLLAGVVLGRARV